MKLTDLQHGDVLMFKCKRNQSPIRAGIRFIQGNSIVHVGVVQQMYDHLVVLEQMSHRLYHFVGYYEFEVGDTCYVARPTFKVPPTNFNLLYDAPYGYLGIADSLINHLISKFKKKWQYRPFLGKYSKNVICSTLVSQALNLKVNTNWVKYDEVVEPDDFWNHDESFQPLGLLEC